MCAAAHMHRPVGVGVSDDPPARTFKLCVGRGALTPPPSTHRTTPKKLSLRAGAHTGVAIRPPPSPTPVS